MKNLLLIALLFSCVFANSQVTDLPQEVTTALKNKYPTAKVDGWSVDSSGFYSVDYYIKSDFYTSVFDKKGLWTETSMVIGDEDAPAQLKAYMAKNYPGYKVCFTEKVQTSASSTFIRLTVFLNGKTIVVQSDENGASIKVVRKEG
jgi:hypothetical protein